MILGCDEAMLRTDHAHWLIVAPVSVLQFVDGGTASLCQKLVAHADAADRTVAGKRFADVLYGSVAGIGVARTVAEEETVVVQVVEVVVPRDADDHEVPLQKAADDVVLDAAVEEHNLFLQLTIEN